MTPRPFTRRMLMAATGILACAAAACPPSAWAQDGKPLRLIVPLTAGSTVDAMARAMSNQFGKATGHPIVIENLVGAGGMTGTVQLVRAPKDGLTLGLVSSNHVINPSIYKSVPFDALADITPITVVGTVPLVLVVHPSVHAKNLQELMALAKAKPGTLNFGSAGNGSTLHLAGELLSSQAGIDIKHVPYRGTGPLTTDLIGGQVEMGFVSITAVAPHIRAGKLRAIGLSTTTRAPALPEVPTLAEQGLKNYSFDAWIALIGPAGLPRPMVDKLYAETKATLATKEVQDALNAQGIQPIGSTPDQAAAFFKTELGKHAELVKRSGATAD